MREHVDLQVNVLGADAIEYKLCAPERTVSLWGSLVYLLWLGAAGCAATWHSQPQPPRAWLVAAAAAAFLAVVLNAITGSVVVEESVLVVPSLGVQVSRRTRSGATTKQFIDAADISAVVVNEAFVFSDVVYYIAFMVRSKEEMVVAFEHFRPRIAILQEVFVQMRQALFPDESAMRLPHLA